MTEKNGGMPGQSGFNDLVTGWQVEADREAASRQAQADHEARIALILDGGTPVAPELRYNFADEEASWYRHATEQQRKSHDYVSHLESMKPKQAMAEGLPIDDFFTPEDAQFCREFLQFMGSHNYSDSVNANVLQGLISKTTKLLNMVSMYETWPTPKRPSYHSVRWQSLTVLGEKIREHRKREYDDFINRHLPAEAHTRGKWTPGPQGYVLPDHPQYGKVFLGLDGKVRMIVGGDATRVVPVRVPQEPASLSRTYHAYQVERTRDEIAPAPGSIASSKILGYDTTMVTRESSEFITGASQIDRSWKRYGPRNSNRTEKITVISPSEVLDEHPTPKEYLTGVARNAFCAAKNAR